MISPRLFIKSLRHAWRGLCDVARAEQSFRLQLVMGAAVVFCVVTLPLLVWERILLILLVVSVLVLEIVNSIFERLADAVHPRMHPTVREIKDMMAGAVLLVACTSAIVGCVIIFPHLASLFCTSALPGVLSVTCAW
ncbi:MAG: diacylglycerol kinase [Patescibacteria group bacterium]